MPKNMELNGLIHSHYDSESQFATAMGWSRQRLNRITNGKKVPDLFDLRDMSIALPCDLMVLVNIFLPKKSTNMDK